MDENSDKKVESSEEDYSSLFFQLFITSQKNLYAFILASVHNYNDADDILQDTATVMWQKFGEFDKNTNFVAWGISISKNLIMKYYNARKRSRVQFSDELFWKISKKMENSVSQIDSRQKALKICSGKLDGTGRLLIDMRYGRGMTIKTIANHLNKSVQGMYKAISRLQDALQKCIKKELLKIEV